MITASVRTAAAGRRVPPPLSHVRVACVLTIPSPFSPRGLLACVVASRGLVFWQGVHVLRDSHLAVAPEKVPCTYDIGLANYTERCPPPTSQSAFRGAHGLERAHSRGAPAMTEGIPHGYITIRNLEGGLRSLKTESVRRNLATRISSGTPNIKDINRFIP